MPEPGQVVFDPTVGSLREALAKYPDETVVVLVVHGYWATDAIAIRRGDQLKELGSGEIALCDE
jgi:hypothetical protein